MLTDKHNAFAPIAIHIATEVPLGWAARRHCTARALRFSIAFHTKFPEILNASLKTPLSLGYATPVAAHPADGSLQVLSKADGVDLLGTKGVCLRCMTSGRVTRSFLMDFWFLSFQMS